MRILRNGLALLVLLALAAGAVWLIAHSRPRPAQVGQGSPLATPTTVRSPTLPRSPSPTPRQPGLPPLPTQAAGRVPFCTFPGSSALERRGPPPDAFTFAEPQVVLTDTVGIDIVDWLPDSRRLLIIRRGRLETLDTRTGDVQVYSTEVGGLRPFWLPQSQAAAYVKGAGAGGGYNLWVSQGDAGAARPVIEGFTPDNLTIDSSGYLVYFIRSGQPPSPVPEVAKGFFQVQIVPFSLDEWMYPKYPAGASYGRKQGLTAARGPNGAQIAFFGDPYLFLFDVAQARVCEVDLGTSGEQLPLFPYDVRWSSNGHFLAMQATARYPGEAIRFARVVILDTANGELIRLELPLKYPTDIAWGPDSQHLMVLGYDLGDGRPSYQLQLVHVPSGQVRRALPESTFGGGGEWQVTWAANGRNIAIKCGIRAKDKPLIVQDRLCLIPVSMKP
jgi:hypothetical protein